MNEDSKVVAEGATRIEQNPDIDKLKNTVKVVIVVLVLALILGIAYYFTDHRNAKKAEEAAEAAKYHQLTVEEWEIASSTIKTVDDMEAKNSPTVKDKDGEDISIYNAIYGIMGENRARLDEIQGVERDRNGNVIIKEDL